MTTALVLIAQAICGEDYLPTASNIAAAGRVMAAFSSAPDSVRQELAGLLNPWRPTWRHKKRGSEYAVVGEAELQCAQDVIEGHELVIYRAKDGKLWARPSHEFYDGRFEALGTSTND